MPRKLLAASARGPAVPGRRPQPNGRRQRQVCPGGVHNRPPTAQGTSQGTDVACEFPPPVILKTREGGSGVGVCRKASRAKRLAVLSSRGKGRCLCGVVRRTRFHALLVCCYVTTPQMWQRSL